MLLNNFLKTGKLINGHLIYCTIKLMVFFSVFFESFPKLSESPKTPNAEAFATDVESLHGRQTLTLLLIVIY